jgi:predicted RNase H-like nuclease
MQVVLGIDAAWTSTQPSGVALAAKGLDGWHLIAAVASYRDFHARADRRKPAAECPPDSMPEARALLASASRLCGGTVDLVAIDMPLAQSPIVGRRNSDDAVSKTYSRRKCGTHSPSASRPGRLSDDLRKGFEQAGYPLRTDAAVPPGVIEVYPHPALVELAGAAERLPYKVSKVQRYWPSVTAPERRVHLCSQWNQIVALLEREIVGVAAALPQMEPHASRVDLKAYEDALDAVICTWVAICALEGRATPFGDENSAIWIPRVAVA